MAGLGANFRSKFSNEINAVLLCMGLFSMFLFGRHS
ncbi:hypothetical protein ACVIN2_004552 [Bradyrhizobium sp. USDA 3650]